MGPSQIYGQNFGKASPGARFLARSRGGAVALGNRKALSVNAKACACG